MVALLVPGQDPLGRIAVSCDRHLLCVVLIGFLILAWWFFWSLIRIIKGFIMLNNGSPIADPRSWLFGSSYRQHECARCQQAACC